MSRVALVQVASPDDETPEARIQRVEGMLREKSGQEIDLFVLPELWAAGYLGFANYEAHAEPFDGPTVTMCRRVAQDLNAWVHVGSFIERDAEGKLHNTTVLIDPKGEVAQTYRKIHVFGYQSLESQLLTPGTTLSVIESPFGRLASTTCYDLRFPGLWLELGARGAEVTVVPAAWPTPRREHFTLFTQARAVEHQLWVIAVNACGVQGSVELGGSSRIVDPWGRIVAECSPTDEQIVVADIDPTLVAEVRTEFPVLGDRLSDEQYAQLG